MKLPLIGLQTNPSGTASSPASRPPSHSDMALSFLPGPPHLLTTWFPKGLRSFPLPPPPRSARHHGCVYTCKPLPPAPPGDQPTALPAKDGDPIHFHRTLQGPLCPEFQRRRAL